METLRDASQYPTFGSMTPGHLDVRVYDASAEASRTADLAAIVVDRHAAGAFVVALCENATNAQNLTDATGLGWSGLGHRGDRFRAVAVANVLDMTAEVFRAWALAAHGTPVVVLVESVTGPATDPIGGGHDDRVLDAWIDAVTTGDVAALENLSGLSFSRYLGTDAPASAVPTSVVAGSRFRRRGETLDDVMGGSALCARAHTVVRLGRAEPAGDRPRTIVSYGRILKHRCGPGATFEVTRPTPRSPRDYAAWQAA